MAVESESLYSISILRTYKQILMLNFTVIKTKNPGLTKKQIYKELGYSDSTFQRCGEDIQVDSPYNRNNYKKKATKQKSTTTTENHSKSEN